MNKGTRKQILCLIFCLFSLAACNQNPSVQILDQDQKPLASFQVEIARTSEEHQKGLQHKTFLGDNEGMLFVFPEAAERSFWMKDTLISLDMLFADHKGYILNIQKETEPCLKNPCKNYYSEGKAQYVLEINAGLSEQLGIKKGDALILPAEFQAQKQLY